MYPETIKHFTLKRQLINIDSGMKYSFICKHCNKVVSEHSFRMLEKKDFIVMENHLQCHLMECDKYQQKEKE